jgi:hypothetical protein
LVERKTTQGDDHHHRQDIGPWITPEIRHAISPSASCLRSERMDLHQISAVSRMR